MSMVRVGVNPEGCRRKYARRGAGEYRVELLRELRRRWMALGVLAAAAAAVLAPPLGASGGILHTQYLCYVPLSYIYYCAGRAAGAGRDGGAAGGRQLAGRVRLLCVSCAHAALVAPALAALLLAGAAEREHLALLHGVLVSSVGGGCAWLSLAVCEDAAAPLLTALNYAASLLTTPLAMLILCGRAAVPTLSSILPTLASTLPAFGAGALAARARAWVSGGAAGGVDVAGGADAARVCALLLLYAQCCDALAVRGSVRVADIVAVLLLEFSWLCLSLSACWAYARCGLLSAADARVVALCAVPKAHDIGWHPYTTCVPSALSRLPGVFLPPAQALLLAAVAARRPAAAAAPAPTDCRTDSPTRLQSRRV